MGGPENDFASVLQTSVLRKMNHKATCPNCKQVRMFDSSRVVAVPDFPPILAVNANVYSEEIFEYWLDTRKQRFLTPSVDLHVETGESEEPLFVTYNLRVSTTFFDGRSCK